LDDLYHDRPAAALARIKADPNLQKDELYYVQSVILAVKLGPRYESEKLMKAMCEQAEARWGKVHPDYVRCCKLMRDFHVNGEVQEKEYAEIQKLLADTEPGARCNFNYFVAEILAANGRKDLAEPLWRVAATRGPFDHYTATLAGRRLASLRANKKSSANESGK